MKKYVMTNLINKKILVTGGAGFIGSHLVDELIKEKAKVFIIDNLSTGRKENINPKAKFYKADIRDFNKIEPFFKNIDFVFHLAAIPRVPLSVKDPVLTSQVNILGTLNVFKAALDSKVKRIVFASSSAVYGNQKKLPLKESMKPDPESPYGLQKLIGEQSADLFTKIYGLPIISLRYFNIYGPRIDFSSDYSLVVGKFLNFSRQKKSLTIFGSGRQTRDFCYVKDAVLAAIKAAGSSKLKGGEVINIGSGESYSINELSRLIGGERKYLPKRPGDTLHTKADIYLAKKLLKWQPKTNLEEGLRETVSWFQKNYKK